MKKEYFGEDAPADLVDINIENIDNTESRILNNLVKDEAQKHEKCVQISEKLKGVQDQMKAEIEAAIKTTSNQNDRNKRVQDIQNKYRKEITTLTQQKVKADAALEKARLKATEYGQKAAKDGKTIGIDGKEVKVSTRTTTTPAASSNPAPTTGATFSSEG